MNDDELLQGMRRVGLAGPPPGFASIPQSQQVASASRTQGNESLDLDEVHLSSIFRLALDDDGVFRPQSGQSAPQNLRQPPQQAQQYFQQPQYRAPPPQQQPQFRPPPQQQQQPLPYQQPPPQYQQPPPQYQQPPPQYQQPPPQYQQQPPSPGMMPSRGSPPVQSMSPMMRPPMMNPMPGMPPFIMQPPQQMFSPMMPPPPHQPMQAPQPQQRADPPRERFKDHQRMKGREVANIVRSQLRTVETGDEFADDFYFYQADERRKVKAQQMQHPHAMMGNLDDVSNDERPAELLKMLKAIQNRSSAAPVIIRAPAGPLPELPGTKTTQQEAMERRLKQSAEATSKWAGEKSVLGRMTKGNLRTPRELIALHNSIMEGEENKGNGCFAGPGWKLRRITLDVSDCVGEVTDLSRHLKARAAALPQGTGAPLQGWEPVYEKVRELERQQLAACERLARLMGLTGEGAEGDDGLLLSLLWLNKGRRTAVRAMKSLLNEHLTLLIEAAARMLVYFVCTAPDGKNSADETEREKYELDMLAATALAREYAQVDLQEAAKCLRLFLASQTPESLRAVIATPGGALVSKALLINGQERSEAGADPALRAAWEDAFQAFIAMAEEGISAKERS